MSGLMYVIETEDLTKRYNGLLTVDGSRRALLGTSTFPMALDFAVI